MDIVVRDSEKNINIMWQEEKEKDREGGVLTVGKQQWLKMEIRVSIERLHIDPQGWR